MKKLIIAALMAVATSGAIAAETQSMHWPRAPRLNTIEFTVSAEEWATSDTAQVIVGVDANLNQAGMDKIQTDVLASLQQMVQSDQWRITQFDRSQDQSGLEKVHVEAQARLPNNQLNNLRSKAESFSKPGMKYQLIDIQYTPSLSDKEVLQERLRQKLYERIKQELDLVSKMYPKQQYYVHKVYFGQNGVTPQPRYKTTANEQTMMMAAAPGSGENFSVNGKTVLNAMVVLAATIEE